MNRTTHSYSPGSTRTTCGARAVNPASVGVISHLNTDQSVPVGWDGVTCEECLISSTESHIPCEVACSTCGAGPDRRCGDAYGEFEAGVYCPGRQQDLMAALILDAETLAEITDAAAQEEVTREESARDLDADTQAKPHGAFVENRDSLKAAQRYATEARHLRLEGRHTEARCALNHAASLRRSALDSATRDEFWITQLKHRCDRKSRG